MTAAVAAAPAPSEAPASRARIFSGIQPSGIVHLGNDLGAVRNYVRLQSEYEAIYCIVDYHALTSTHESDVLRERTTEMAASLLALGLDPERCTLFVQSHRPEHTELAWLLCTVTPVSWLERTPTYKEKRQNQPDDINHGLLTYPVLQAADIVMYKASLVPVGKDTKKLLADRIIAHYAPARERYLELMAHPAEVAGILEAGADRLRPMAAATMDEVRRKMGLR